MTQEPKVPAKHLQRNVQRTYCETVKIIKNTTKIELLFKIIINFI